MFYIYIVTNLNNNIVKKNAPITTKTRKKVKKMLSSHPTTLTFCHFAQPLVGKTHENDKIAINENFISQFLLPLVCKTNEFAKNAINQNFATQFSLPLIGKTAENGKNAINQKFISEFLLPLVCKSRKNDKIAKNQKFISQFLLPLGGKTNEFAKNAINRKFEAVAIPAGNLVRLCLTKPYKTSWVMNNQRSWFFINYLCNLVRLCPAKKYIASRAMNNLRSKFFVMYIVVMNNQRSWFFINYIAVTNNWRMPIFRPLYCEAVAIPAGNLVRLSLTKPYKTSWVTNNWRMPIFRQSYCHLQLHKKIASKVWKSRGRVVINLSGYNLFNAFLKRLALILRHLRIFLRNFPNNFQRISKEFLQGFSLRISRMNFKKEFQKGIFLLCSGAGMVVVTILPMVSILSNLSLLCNNGEMFLTGHVGGGKFHYKFGLNHLPINNNVIGNINKCKFFKLRSLA